LRCQKSQIVRQLICQKCQISSSELSGFAWKLLSRLIRIVGMVRFSDPQTVGLSEMLNCQTVNLSEMSDRLIGIVGMVRLSDYQTVRIVRLLDC
jgi:hypothetical protein